MQIDESAIKLYNIAKERCHNLMADDIYRGKILSSNHEEILTKGYFNGFYDALSIINQIKK